jgi:hypothetical protein
MALVNEPGAPTRTVQLGGTFYDADGNAVTSVTLRAKDGAILRGTPPAAPAGQDGPQAIALPAPVASPTQTLLEAPRTAEVGIDVAGSVKGATGGTVVVSVQRKTAKGFKIVRKKTVKVSAKGRFRTKVAKLSHGRYRAFATYVGSAKAKASTSSKRAFKLRTRH